MAPAPIGLSTLRLSLRPWSLIDREPFARMNADPEVMYDLGGPLTRAESDDKAKRFTRVFEENGFTRWVVERSGPAPEFIGYCGITPVGADHPIGQHFEIGWRLVRAAWGNGYASEAAAAALHDGFDRVGLSEILAYTAADNARSQAVMSRLGLTRREDLDFTKRYDDVGLWSAMVWTARPPYSSSGTGDI